MSDGSNDEDALTPEVRCALDEIWREFDAIQHPRTAQIAAHLERLIALPSETGGWNDLFQLFISRRHADLSGVFRGIAASVRPTKEAALSFLY